MQDFDSNPCFVTSGTSPRHRPSRCRTAPQVPRSAPRCPPKISTEHDTGRNTRVSQWLLQALTPTAVSNRILREDSMSRKLCRLTAISHRGFHARPPPGTRDICIGEKKTICKSFVSARPAAVAQSQSGTQNRLKPVARAGLSPCEMLGWFVRRQSLSRNHTATVAAVYSAIVQSPHCRIPVAGTSPVPIMRKAAVARVQLASKRVHRRKTSGCAKRSDGNVSVKSVRHIRIRTVKRNERAVARREEVISIPGVAMLAEDECDVSMC